VKLKNRSFTAAFIGGEDFNLETDMKKHANIPIFIPHLGCPNNCVFCNQRSISGTQQFNAAEVIGQIEEALATIDGKCETEIAFFGGSFTGIDRELMIYLLDTAQKYIDSGAVSAIRLSTRPDYIDREILDILSRYGVRTIELGLQSMKARVLEVTRRGHSVSDAERACKLIKEYGFELIGQMMIGLPASSVCDEIYTAEKICDMGADGARVYPTVVFYNTELCNMAERGEYLPLNEEDAVMRTKEIAVGEAQSQAQAVLAFLQVGGKIEAIREYLRSQIHAVDFSRAGGKPSAENQQSGITGAIC
jgi:histone acetyltransferase (RNA polymerase elongator complex component)